MSAKRLWKQPFTAMLIAAAVLVVLAVGVLGNSRGQDPSSHGRAGVQMKGARWITLPDGKKVWGVPLVLQSKNGRVSAHLASYGVCTYCTSRRNLGSGLCMSSYPNIKGLSVKQYPCNGSANQEWIYAKGSGYGNNLLAYNSPQLCLDNRQGAFFNGNLQILWPCNSNSRPAYALWYGHGASFVAGRDYQVIHLSQGLGQLSHYCLTTRGNKTPGSPIVEWTCDPNSRNQAFSGDWEPLDPPG